MAVWLAEHGHDVRVVTAPPYYPAWRTREDYRNTWYRTERLPGKPVVYRTPLYVPRHPTGLKRIAHLMSFSLGSLPVMLRQVFWEPHLVFCVEPTFFCAPLALFVGRSAGAVNWLHVQDFEVDAAFELGLLPLHGPVRDAALRIEKFFTFAFDRVSGISLRMVDRAIAKGLPPYRVTFFPNWVDTDEIYPLDPNETRPNPIRLELTPQVADIKRKVILLYSGNMGAKQGVELLAPLAGSFVDDPRVHFVFCGDGAFRGRLEKLVDRQPNVTMLPLQPLNRLNYLLNAADIHLLPQRASAADLVMPSRLSAMFSSGRPVIATAQPGTQLAQIVEGRGLVVSAEDATALHAAVLRLVEDKELRLRLGNEARRYAVEHLGKQEVLERFDLDLSINVGTRHSANLSEF
jgi:colanic acid biosynthesis glycosyl transferase WcaI